MDRAVKHNNFMLVTSQNLLLQLKSLLNNLFDYTIRKGMKIVEYQYVTATRNTLIT
jgi:hypothetical protein